MCLSEKAGPDMCFAMGVGGLWWFPAPKEYSCVWLELALQSSWVSSRNSLSSGATWAGALPLGSVVSASASASPQGFQKLHYLFTRGEAEVGLCGPHCSSSACSGMLGVLWVCTFGHAPCWKSLLATCTKAVSRQFTGGWSSAVWMEKCPLNRVIVVVPLEVTAFNPAGKWGSSY